MNVCELCGGKTTSKYGVCQNTPDCLRENKQRSNERFRADGKMCEHCGRFPVYGINFKVCQRTEECKQEYDKRYRAHNLSSVRLRAVMNGAKNRAKRDRVPFALTIEDLPQMPDVCPVLGIKLERGSSHGPERDSQPSLDRIIPERGYVPGNVQWLSFKANRMKNNGSPTELILFANWVLRETALPIAA